uniref:Glycosyltransferase n=1 Tax=candidate division WOR-3 bacterium TaxID=2052148 RepID=A0A7C3J775_UNCW3
MKIIYGVAGHGNGHITRSTYVINFLEKNGCKVKILTYGQGIKYLNIVKKDADYHDISGFDIIYKDGVVRNYRTFYEFLKRLPLNTTKQFIYFFKMLYQYKPDLVLSDFEPFSQIFAKTVGVPLINIDNNITVNILKEIPDETSFTEKYFTQLVINLFERKANYHFILSFADKFIDLPKESKYKVIIVPPIIRREVIEIAKEKEDGDFILIYQTSKSLIEKINELTKSFPEVKFVSYGLDLEERKNLKKENFSRENFLKDLSKCKGVITNGGFTLISESIYLKKPIFSVPIKGQYEQRVNSFLVEKMGYGKSSLDFSTNDFKIFLRNIEDYKKNLKNYIQDENKIFESKLLKIISKIEPGSLNRFYETIFITVIPVIQLNLLKFFFAKIFPIYKKQIKRLRNII